MTVTAIDLSQGKTPLYNQPQKVTLQVGTENSLTVTVSKGKHRVLVIRCDQDWWFRSVTASANQFPVYASETLRIRFPVSMTVFFQAQTADGNMYVMEMADGVDSPIM